MRAAVLALLIAHPASAQEAGPPDGDIVVVAPSTVQTRQALEACIARRCPPPEDIAASLAHAESQFLAGDYVNSRRTLSEARSRNARFDEQYPVAVGDLFRALGRITDANGLPEKNLLLQIRSFQALKAGLDDDDSRVLLQRLMVGDAFAREDRPRAAQDIYRAVASRAAQSGKPYVQGHAMLREAMMYGAYSVREPMYRSTFGDRLRRIEAMTAPEFESFRLAVQVLRAKIAELTGDKGALDATIAAIPAQAGEPFLIHSPKVGAFVSPKRANSLNQDPEWVDLRFSIRADGTVIDVKAVRYSGKREPSWTAAILKSVAARRYAKLIVPEGEDAMVRVERCAYVHDLSGATGTGMKMRSDEGRFSWMDLTAHVSRASGAGGNGSVPESR